MSYDIAILGRVSFGSEPVGPRTIHFPETVDGMEELLCDDYSLHRIFVEGQFSQFVQAYQKIAADRQQSSVDNVIRLAAMDIESYKFYTRAGINDEW